MVLRSPVAFLLVGLFLCLPTSLMASELQDEVRGGDLEAVKKLVESGEELNSFDENGFTPLLIAGWTDRKDIANYLLAKGADPTIKGNKTKYTLFTIIVSKGWADVAEHLMSKYNIGRSEIDKALWTSASLGYDNLVAALIRHGGNVNGTLPATPFLAALRGGHMKTVELLLRSGAVLNVNEPEDDPPIRQALGSQHREIAEFLLSKGARVDAISLRLAVNNGYLDLAELILQKGVPLKEVEDNFLDYVRKGELEKVRFLITHHVDIESPRTRDGYNGLMIASSAGNLNMVRLLIDSGAQISSKVIPPPNISSSDINGTALIVAASAGSTEVVDFLLSRGADVNANTYAKGDTSLRRAARKGYYDVVTRLLLAGASVNVVDFSGDTPLISSLKAKAWKVADKLIEAGADISIINKKGILHTALSQNDAVMVDYLLSKNVDVNLQVEGVSPLMIAARLGKISWIQALLRKGASPDPTKPSWSTALFMALDYVAYPSSMLIERHQGIEKSIPIRKETAKLLLESGANINRKDYKGMTALDYAVRENEREIQEFLKANGARTLAGWLDEAAASVTAWRGVVKDKTTGRAIAGAAVVRSWERLCSSPLGTDHEFLGYREDISAEDGSFSVRSLGLSPPPHCAPLMISQVVDYGSFVYRPGYKVSRFDGTASRVELERLPPDRELRKAELAEVRGSAGKKALRYLSSVISDEEEFLRLTSPDEYRKSQFNKAKRVKFLGKPEKRTADEPIEVEVSSGSGAGIAISPDQIRVVKDRREKPPETPIVEKPKPIRIKESDPPELLRRALGSAKYTILERAKAASLLGKSRAPIDVDIFIVSLLDDPPVRDEACKSLEQLGAIAIDTLVRIVEIDEGDEKIRQRLQQWFPGVDFNTYSVDERRIHAKQLAIKALGMIGDDRGIRSLASILRSPKSHHSLHVQEAIKALGNIKTIESADVLIEFAENPPPFIDYRKTVFESLREMGEPAVLALSAKLKVTDFTKITTAREFFANAIRVLSETADPRSVPVLLDLLAAPDSFLRELARDALAEMDDPRAVSAVMAAWEGEEPTARREATWGIVQLGTLAVESLRRHLAAGLPKNRMRAAWALGWIGDPLVIDDLAKLRKDEVFEVRWIAIEALGRFDNPAAENAIREFCLEEAAGLRIVADVSLKTRKSEGCKEGTMGRNNGVRH